MAHETYNGWTNYATWRVNLEVFDGLSANDLMGRRGSNVLSEVAEYIREYVEETIGSGSEPGLARDYALAFLSDVNWYEIATNLCESDADETTDEAAE